MKKYASHFAVQYDCGDGPRGLFHLSTHASQFWSSFPLAMLRALFDNGWLHLLTLKDGGVDARYRPGLAFSDETPKPAFAA